MVWLFIVQTSPSTSVISLRLYRCAQCMVNGESLLGCICSSGNLGHKKVSALGLCIDPDCTQAVHKCPLPKDAKGVDCCRVMVNCYHKFISQVGGCWGPLLMFFEREIFGGGSSKWSHMVQCKVSFFSHWFNIWQICAKICWCSGTCFHFIVRNGWLQPSSWRWHTVALPKNARHLCMSWRG
jgi:hypothetical protein